MPSQYNLILMQTILCLVSLLTVGIQQLLFNRNLKQQTKPEPKFRDLNYQNLHFTVKEAYDSIFEALKRGQPRLQLCVSPMPCKPDFIEFYKSITYGHKIKHDYHHDTRTDLEYMNLHLDTFMGPRHKPLAHIKIEDKAPAVNHSTPPPLPTNMFNKKVSGGYTLNPLSFLQKSSGPGQVIQVDFKRRTVIK